MNAYLRWMGCGCIALGALACGSKGDGSDDGAEAGAGGTSGSSSGGSSTGGSAGSSTGGSSGSGTGGSGMLPIKVTYSFDTDEDGWGFIYTSAESGDPADAVPEAEIVIGHTSEDGDPEPGAFEVSIPYSKPSQYVTVGINFATDDLTNRTISARVKVVSGLGDEEALMMNPGGAKIYAKAGAEYCYTNGVYNNLGDNVRPIGEWHEIEYDLNRPDFVDSACTFDPSDVREIGIQFDTSGTIAEEDVLPAVIRVDTVTY